MEKTWHQELLQAPCGAKVTNDAGRELIVLEPEYGHPLVMDEYGDLLCLEQNHCRVIFRCEDGWYLHPDNDYKIVTLGIPLGFPLRKCSACESGHEDENRIFLSLLDGAGKPVVRRPVAKRRSIS